MKLDFEFEKGFLDKKNILVTGASKGIGREIALGLSKFCLLYTSPSPRD